MKIFDCHLHIESGLEQYDIDVQGRNIIFNSIDSYKDNISKLNIGDSVSVIFDYKNNSDFVSGLLARNEINALKIHSRIQKISANGYPELIENLKRMNPRIPLIIDAFYFGVDYEYQPNLECIIKIAKAFPNLPIVVAHSGGIELLKYFYHLKSLTNIYFELSLGLAYLKNTSVFMDYKNLIRYGNDDKILFGTDFPFISAKAQLETFLEITKELNSRETTIEKILFSNSETLFMKKTDNTN